MTGRSKPFSELLHEHKKLKKLKKIEKLRLAANPIQGSPSLSSPLVTSPIPNLMSGSPLSPSSPPPPPQLPPPPLVTIDSTIDRSPLPSSALVYLGGSDDEEVEVGNTQMYPSVARDDDLVPEQQLYPKPAAVSCNVVLNNCQDMLFVSHCIIVCNIFLPGIFSWIKTFLNSVIRSDNFEILHKRFNFTAYSIMCICK